MAQKLLPDYTRFNFELSPLHKFTEMEMFRMFSMVDSNGDACYYFNPRQRGVNKVLAEMPENEDDAKEARIEALTEHYASQPLEQDPCGNTIYSEASISPFHLTKFQTQYSKAWAAVDAAAPGTIEIPFILE